MFAHTKIIKSRCFYLAQLAVLDKSDIPPEAKLVVLRELMGKEDIALFTEKQEEKEKGNG